jgi:uncharacterized protein YndB with AHSA1/START domain
MAQCRPETIDFLDRAPTKVVVERDVDAPPERVFEVLADTPSWPQWFPSVRVARWTSGDNGGVGSTRFVDAAGLKVHERFIAWEPGRRWAFTFLRTNVPLARAGVECADLEPLDSGRTRVRYTMALELRRPVSWLAGRFAERARSGIADGLDGLAAFLSANDR